MSDPNWLEKQWAETDPRPRGELLAALAEQAATIERLRGERDRWQHTAVQQTNFKVAANKSAYSISTELARVREALRVRACDVQRGRHRTWRVGECVDAGECGCSARAALGPAKSAGDA